ncbi:hypothetical protein FVER14953_21747 [Fusarium verticillioides]|nr:hypothetical protein FVER14953_21747 [Fusarium verticillioides]
MKNPRFYVNPSFAICAGTRCETVLTIHDSSQVHTLNTERLQQAKTTIQSII